MTEIQSTCMQLSFEIIMHWVHGRTLSAVCACMQAGQRLCIIMTVVYMHVFIK